jgi:hypothetical protein
MPHLQKQESNNNTQYTLVTGNRDGKIVPNAQLRLQRLCWLSTASLGTSLVFIVAALSVPAFLWFGSRDNTSWRRIALGTWMTRAVAISSTSDPNSGLIARDRGDRDACSIGS